MEGHPANKAALHCRRDLGLVLILILLSAGLRVWHLGHTEVAARDSIGYIRLAWQFQHQAWPQVLRAAEQHPGYPLAILAMSRIVRPFVDGPESVLMQVSAQLASALAGVLLVVPAYYLGRDLFDRGTAFWAGVLFQCLPSCGRVLSDGLSEALFLLFAVTSLFFAERALRGNSSALFALCGVSGGFAYLVRPEGALIIAAAGLVLFAIQMRAISRRPWASFLKCGLSLGLCSLAVAGPFIAIIGRPTTKPTPLKILKPAASAPSGDSAGESVGAEHKRLSPSALDPKHPYAGSRPLLASLNAVWWQAEDSGRLWWGLRSIGFVLARGFFYVLWVPALFGLWWFRDRFRCVPGMWVMALVCLALVLLLWRVAALMGYVSDRHLMLVLFCGTYWAVAALRELPYKLGLLGSRMKRWKGSAQLLFAAARPATATACLLALAASALPRTAEPLHYDRAGFRDAGLWLAAHAGPEDVVIDPYRWAHSYAGHVFLEGNETGRAPSARRTQYVVLERSTNPHSRLTLVNDALRLAEQGKIVYRAPVYRRKDRDAEVVVYEVSPR